uniref:Caspase recruitment domain family member 10 n=1 Tax=Pseudonaja textilis TaxID=8673 RepID=A0A670XVF0_PSETE
EKIESVRHQLTRSLNPEKLTPYLRQCRVIDEQDEEEVLSAYRFPCRSNRTGLLMDILRRRGKRGYEAFLESLEFYYPEHFTRLTGKQPVQRCSIILDEEGPEGLTQFLMMEVKKVRAQRKEHLAKEHQLQIKNQGLEKECSQLKQHLQRLQKMQERWQRFQEEWDTNSLELLRLKDENYLLAMRYAQLCEEKNTAVLRSRDLQLGMDQLKCKITCMEEECSLLKKQTLMAPQQEVEDHGFTDISDLQTENQRLIASLQELQNVMQKAREDQAPGSERVLLDILEHDWKEAQADRQELCQKLNSLQNELQCAEQLRDKYLQEMEDLQLKFHTLQKNCELYKHRMNTVLGQLEEIEKERDQAIQSRDDIQLQYSQSLIEKDQYRKRVRNLEEERDDLLSKLTQAEGKIFTLEGQLQRCLCNRGLAKKICSSSHSLYSSSWSIIEKPLSPEDGIVDSPDILDIVFPRDSEVTPDREKEINRLSIFPFPPCAGSILRRQREDGPTPFKRSVMVHLSNSGSLSVPGPQSRGLTGDISILGGNRTGIYIHWVKPGSEAEKAGLREGSSTFLVGCWSVGTLKNSFLSCILFSLLGYQPLKEAFDSRKKILGDSFYVRTNLSLLEISNPYALCVKCREILHVTDTLYKGQLEWYCARVDPFTLQDLDKGTVPNYNRNTGILLIWYHSSSRIAYRKPTKSLPLFIYCFLPTVGVEKPYSLVHPVVVQTRRPIMLSPGCLAPLLLKKLLDLPSSSQDFCFSPAGELTHRVAHHVSLKIRPCLIIFLPQKRHQNQHCLLELEVQLVKELIKSEIYPIIIHIKVTEKKIKGVRSLLGKPGQRDSEVLKKCQRDEWVLHTLPCSWVWVDPQSWSSAEDLVKVVRAHIFQEQTRMVWVEENDM